MSEVNRGRLFVISSGSGGGKTTIINRIMKNDPSLALSVSHTTRKVRGDEMDGVEYHFVRPDQFRVMVADGLFLEWAEVYGNLYGTTRAAVEKELDTGKDVLLDIDVQGAQQVKELMPEAVTVFIQPPSEEELERRLRSRGTDSEEDIVKRLLAAKDELANKEQYDYSVLNDDLAEAVRSVEDIIRRVRQAAPAS
jgi:guanylate kinase